MSLIVKDLSFSYKKGPLVLDNISLELKPGEISALIGQNGSGKTTVLKCINGILKPSTGIMDFEGQSLKVMNLKERAKLMSYVPQSIPSSMHFKVFDVVLMGRRPYLNWGISHKDRLKVFSILDQMCLQDLCFRPYDELSGGQKQKVLIARALVQEPSILMMDEPTSNLDLRHQLDVLLLLRKIAAEKGISVLLSAHDLNLVMNFADRLEMLKDGHICHSGAVNSVLSSKNIKDVFEVDTHVGQHKGTSFVLLNKTAQ